MPVRSSKMPTEAEMEILQILWENGPSTVREVHEIVSEPRGTAYTTTLKVMQVMHEKGLVTRDDSERSHRFSAAIERERTRQSVVKQLIDRVFGGSADELVLSALGAAKVRPDELRQIKELLAKKDRQGGGK
ncbi:MAG: BlaI/MecI/CopY family transcriptional regulator [Verrucomicrobiaceae bacterium]|nr:BlaI/MecI/CopY family transcriptional regulator [Verrucomicrobiaceae bacterium]